MTQLASFSLYSLAVRRPKEPTNLAVARHLLRSIYPAATNLTTLVGGEMTQAYAFEAEGEQLVLRVNSHFGYDRDLWVGKLIDRRAVPFPAVLAAGETEGKFWAVSRRAPGTIVWDFTVADQRRLVPQMIAILQAIHATDISAFHGFGPVRDDGNGTDSTWATYLRQSVLRDNLQNVKRASARAPTDVKGLLETLVGTAYQLLPDEPPRSLIHRDFNLANILAVNGSVTGVIDWQGVGYGDASYDAAWTDFWSPHLGFASAYGVAIGQVDWRARVRCYQLLMAARSIAFFVNTDQLGRAEMPLTRGRALLGP